MIELYGNYEVKPGSASLVSKEYAEERTRIATEQMNKRDLFWQYYWEGAVIGKPNVYAASQKAGIHVDVRAGWFKKGMKKAPRVEMLTIAERNLREYLTMEPEDVVDKKIKADATKFVTERLGKDYGYSLRQEHTGADGAKIDGVVVYLPQKNKADEGVEASHEAGDSAG